MANKNWKKRLRNIIKDKDFQKLHFGVGFLTSFTFVTSFFSVGIMNPVVIFNLCLLGILGALNIREIFFVENSFFDEKERKQEKEVLRAVDKIEKEQENQYFCDVSNWASKRKRMISLVINEDDDFQSEMIHMIQTMQYIIESCPLTEEQKKYFVHDFPNEMCDILSTYIKLQGTYKEKMEQDIVQLMRDKREGWHHIYIEPFQQELTEQCTKQIQHAYRKETEKVYITD